MRKDKLPTSGGATFPLLRVIVKCAVEYLFLQALPPCLDLEEVCHWYICAELPAFVGGRASQKRHSDLIQHVIRASEGLVSTCASRKHVKILTMHTERSVKYCSA